MAAQKELVTKITSKILAEHSFNIRPCLSDSITEAFVQSACELALAIFACGTKLMLIANNPEITSTVAALVAKYNFEAKKTKSWDKASPPLVYPDALIIEIGELEAMNTYIIPNRYSHLKTSFQFSNSLIQALNSKDESLLPQLNRLFSYLDIKIVNKIDPFVTGKVTAKEEQTFLYNGSFGAIQIGIPPETIKTSMVSGEAVPQIYILPPKLFTGDINMGDVEFPIYFNFFIKKAFANPDARVVMIGTEDQLERVRISFQESSVGPKDEHLYLDEDIADYRKEEGYMIDFAAEREYLAFKDKSGSPSTAETFAIFRQLDEDGKVTFDHKYTATTATSSSSSSDGGAVEEEKVVTISVESANGIIKISENGELKGAMETVIQASADQPKGAGSSALPEDFGSMVEAFEPPVFGVTFIGVSHGFDPKGRTTGFIVWINGNGVVVDPPVQTTQFLRDNGIHRRFITHVILTHCHSDHDSGVIKKILEGEKINLYTTKTVHESYKRKVNAMTGLDDVEKFYTFHQVKIGEKVNILGAFFEFDYSFHTIPCVRFKCSFEGKCISYSADTFYSPSVYTKLVADGTFTLQREVSLRQFLFDADMIIHESGIPPIHTSVSELNDLPYSLKEKIYIVHCAGVPEETTRLIRAGEEPMKVKVTGLQRPKPGVKNTVVLSVGAHAEGFSSAARMFKILSEIWYFRNLSPPNIYELFSLCEKQVFARQSVIINAGEESDYFYVISSGQIDIFSNYGEEKQVHLLSLTRGQYFGETALGSHKEIHKRTATVVSRTSCVLFRLSGKTFSKVRDKMPGLNIDYDLRRVTKYRPFLRALLEKSFLFNRLKPDQIESIAAIISEEKEYPAEVTIFKQGDTDSSLFLIKEGSVRLEKFDPELGDISVEFMRLGPGDSFGEITLITGLPRTAAAITNTPTVLLELRRDDFTRILEEYQNIRFHILSVVEHRLQETRRVAKQVQKRLSSKDFSVYLKKEPLSASAPASTLKVPSPVKIPKHST